MSENFPIYAVICELNPPHNGHDALFSHLRRAGAGCVLAVMSGNFVQRGAPAVFDKWTRTRAALTGGADLVIELPLPWALAGAERFAGGAVSLLGSLNCVDVLAFGSECGRLEPLQALAEALCSPAFPEAFRQARAADGAGSFASVRQRAAAALVGEETASLLAFPNNILAVAYCQALLRAGSSIRPVTVLRPGGDPASSPETAARNPSAAFLRSLLEQDPRCDLAPYLPPPWAAILEDAAAKGLGPVFPRPLETAVLARLRTLSPADLAALPDVSEGLDRRLYQAARTAGSLEQLYEAVKVKRYSHARIRRLVWSAFLGVTAADSQGPVPYCRVLGMNQRGAQTLPHLGKTAAIPLLVNSGDVKKLDGASRRLFDLECRAGDLYALACPAPQPCGRDWTNGVIITQS